MAALRELHEARWWLGPEGLVEALATRFGTFQFALLTGGRRDRWRRLRFLADQAQSFVESRRGDLTEFLRWADLQQSEVVRVTSPVLPEADLEAVRVMTIHASKGLEFPVVALFGLGSQRSAKARVSVLWGNAGPEVKFGSKGSTVDYESLAPADEQMEQAERVRLLYVAATRAKDRLLVCAHHKATKSPPKPGKEALGLLLHRHQPEDRPDLVGEWVPSGLHGITEPPAPPAILRPDEPEVVRAAVERAGFEAARAALVAPDRAVWSATAVAKAAAGADEAARVVDTDVTPEGESDEPTHGRRGRAGTAVGRAVHGTLQLVDLQTLEGLDGIARSQAEAEGIDAMLPTVAGLARAAAGAPVIRDLISRPHWREMYVAAPVDGVMVEGYVDLLADDGTGGLVVLDYKTDSVSSEAQVAERTARYRLQAATYALALEEVTGRPVTRAVFLFLSGATARESDVADLEAAKAEVRAVLARS
jgi:ATP-dependent exoDNAse (exonuclease V) beta subunit